MDGGQAAGLAWHSGRPCESGACVEVATAGDVVLVRSSADPDGARLTMSHDEWVAFVGSVRDGLFDAV